MNRNAGLMPPSASIYINVHIFFPRGRKMKIIKTIENKVSFDYIDC